MESDGLLLEDAVEAFFTAIKLFVQGLGHGKIKFITITVVTYTAFKYSYRLGSSITWSI